MIEVYSNNVTVNTEEVFPLNNVTIQKGCTATLSGSTIQLNKCGVYQVCVDCALEPDGAGEVAIQLYKDGVPQPQAYSAFTGESGDTSTASFVTLVQCPQNNTPCYCTSSTNLTIVNVGAEDVTGHINVTVTKIC